MSGEKETLLEEIEQSLSSVRGCNLRHLCERCGIDGSQVKGKSHRSLQRKIMEEMWENANSVKSEEQGMSWLLRLKDDIRRIQEESTVAAMRPSQSDDDDATDCDEEWDMENKDWCLSNGLEAEPAPENHTPEQRQRGDMSLPPVYPLPESPGLASPAGTLLLGLKRVSLRLVDCRKTLGLSGTTRGGEEKEYGDSDSMSSSRNNGDNPNGRLLSGRVLSSGKAPGLKVIQRPYSCDVCEKSFPHLGDLKRHQRIHTREKPYGCDQCGKSFCTSGQRIIHKRTHTGEKPHSCDQCGKSFARTDYLAEHKLTHTGEKPYLCSDCGKSFYTPAKLKEHERSHSGENPFGCGLCGKTFACSGSLTNHKRVHTGEKPYSCDQCERSCKDATALNEHMRTHTGEKPFRCHVCGMSFSRRNTQKVHMRRHTGEKPYSCDQCGKRFAHPGDLKIHIRVHTGEKPYSCDQCGKRFTQSTNLTKHRRVHAGEKP